jgi:hypothetical protein
VNDTTNKHEIHQEILIIRLGASPTLLEANKAQGGEAHRAIAGTTVGQALRLWEPNSVFFIKHKPAIKVTQPNEAHTEPKERKHPIEPLQL